MTMSRLILCGSFVVFMANVLLFPSSKLGGVFPNNPFLRLPTSAEWIDERVTSTATTEEEGTDVRTLKNKKTIAVNEEMIVWFGQGPASNAALWKNRFSNSIMMKKNTHIFYHAYDDDCNDDNDDDDATDHHSYLHCIFQRNTTYASGRNLALRHALLEATAHQWNVKYFVAFDSDLIMTCPQNQHRQTKKTMTKNLRPGNDDPDNDNYCWVQFQQMLFQPNVQYPIVSPATWREPIEEGNVYQTCSNNAIKAYRPDIVPLYYPMVTEDDSIHIQRNWWLTANVEFEINARCYPHIVFMNATYRIDNPTHSSYPSNGAIQRSDIWAILYEEYSEVFPHNNDDDENMNQDYLHHRCSVVKANNDTNNIVVLDAPQPSKEYWPTCQGLFQKRFKNWIGGTNEVK